MRASQALAGGTILRVPVNPSPPGEAARIPGPQIDVHLDQGLKVGFVMIILNTFLVVATGVLSKGQIPRQFGFLSLSLYVIYMVLSLAILFADDD